MKPVRSKLSAVLAFGIVGMAACGSDSTGPTDLDSASALHSLSLALGQFGENGTTATLDMDASFGGIAPFLNQVTVNIDGADQKMYALAFYESFPAGTCEEVIFGNIVPAEPTCNVVPLTLAVMLWQARSPSDLPDRMVMLVGDVGTSNFDFNLDTETLPAVGFYVVGENDMWVSRSGTLTSAVAATTQTCNVPLPLYAKSGGCSIATFLEQGSIVFEPLDLTGTGTATSTRTQTLTIPLQTLHGLWMAISEVQPIGLTAARLIPPRLMQRLHAR